jgi:hypothetical protein
MHPDQVSRQKHKKRKTSPRRTYPNELDEIPVRVPRVKRKSYPSFEDVTEKYVIKEYDGNQLKTKIVFSKHNKIHPMDTDSDTDTDTDPYSKCSPIAAKLVSLLCYLGILSCVAI